MFNRLFHSSSSVSQITVADLKNRLSNHESFDLIDVRSPAEYSGDGHIKGARLMPLPALSQRLNELSKDRTIVVICRSGNRSQSAAEVLERSGFQKVVNVQGGMGAWQAAGFPMSFGGKE